MSTDTTTTDTTTEAPEEVRDYAAELEAEGLVTAAIAAEFGTLTEGLAVSLARADAIIAEAGGTAGTVELYASRFCPDLCDGLWNASYAYKALKAGRVMLAGGSLAEGLAIRALIVAHKSWKAGDLDEVRAILKTAWGRKSRPPTEAEVLAAARKINADRYPTPPPKPEADEEEAGGASDESEPTQSAGNVGEASTAPETPDDGLGPVPSGTSRSAAIQYVGALGDRAVAQLGPAFPDVAPDVIARIAFVTLGDVLEACRNYSLRGVFEAYEATKAAGSVRRATAPAAEATLPTEADEADGPTDADLATIAAEAEAKAEARAEATVQPITDEARAKADEAKAKAKAEAKAKAKAEAEAERKAKARKRTRRTRSTQ